MRTLTTFALLLGLTPASLAQDTLPFDTFEAFTDSLAALGGIADADERDAAVDALWDTLADADQIPFRLGDEAAFLWRGSASTVRVAGDHNRWNPSSGPLARIGLSDVWMRTYTFPEAARLDYKLVVNGNWILDPVNPHQQWGGLGPNSELRMPAWVFPEETVRDPEVPTGTFGSNQTLVSTALGYAVTYRVYTPSGYDAATLADLPVLYITDGHEYGNDQLGAVRIVLDNLIADGRAEPTIAVFIDPRRNGQNLRQEQYVQNPDFAAFVAEELVPTIDAAFRTRPDRDSRVILGTSLGGLFSAYLGLLHPETFGKLAIQSPAFWVSESPDWWTGSSIYEMMAEADTGLFDIYMSTGTINDTEDGARQMRAVFEATNQALTYREVPESHSWGNWRALIDEVLLTLLPGMATGTETAGVTGPSLTLSAYPNPTAEGVAFAFTLGVPARTELTCYDVLGRRNRSILSDSMMAAGPHTIAVPTTAFGSVGTYLCRLTAGTQTATQTVTVVR